MRWLLAGDGRWKYNFRDLFRACLVCRGMLFCCFWWLLPLVWLLYAFVPCAAWLPGTCGLSCVSSTLLQGNQHNLMNIKYVLYGTRWYLISQQRASEYSLGCLPTTSFMNMWRAGDRSAIRPLNFHARGAHSNMWRALFGTINPQWTYLHQLNLKPTSPSHHQLNECSMIVV